MYTTKEYTSLMEQEKEKCWHPLSALQFKRNESKFCTTVTCTNCDYTKDISDETKQRVSTLELLDIIQDR